MDARNERKWVLAWGAGIALVTSVPYIWGMLITPPDHQFLGLTHNIDDGAVYLSWMRQAADGHFFIRNLFTNDPHPAKAFNVLFLLMGLIARVTHLPLIWVFHLFRVGLGIVLIYVIQGFARLFIDKPEHRRILAPLVGFSAGIGWLVPGARPPTGPVDVWQPEAITFLSIYLNPLFLAGQILMLGAFGLLEAARRSGRVRDAVYAGLCLLALGNIHTYDVVTVACVWTALLLAYGVGARRLAYRTLALSLLAAVIAVPSVAYQAYLLLIDPLYHARAATPTPSPALWAYFAGYGLVLLGAMVGAGLHVKALRAQARASSSHTFRSPLLLFVWSVVGFIVPYIPVAQQRKLVMGLHIPLCILCAAAVSHLLERVPSAARRAAAITCVALAAISSVKFMAEDMRMLSEGATAPGFSPFISRGELSALRRIREIAGPRDSVLAPPGFALFTPAFAGVAVYYGHWSETPNYGERLREWLLIDDSNAPIAVREAVLLAAGATYLVRYAQEGESDPIAESQALAPGFATGGPSGSRIEVYRIRGAGGAGG